MGKGHGKESGVTDKDIVKSDNLKDITPGKATHIPDDGRVGDRSIDDEAVCHGEDRGMQGCFLGDRQRDKLIGDLKDRARDASTQFTIAVEALKVQELIKKPEDMHWAWGMLLDIASNFVIGSAIKSLTKAKAGLISGYADGAQTAIMGGRYDDAHKSLAREAMFNGISNEGIRQQVAGIGGLAKTNARRGMQAAFAGGDREKAATIDYLSRLQATTRLAFQDFASNVSASSTDAELVVIWEGLSVEYHSVEMYKSAISEKVKRYKSSGVDRLGRSSNPWEVGEHLDRRVIWVQHEDGTRSLWFQERASKDDGKPGPKTAFGSIGPGTERLTGLVPREFWEEAVAVSETQWGPSPTVMDSPETRAARGVSPGYADRMSAARAKKPQDLGTAPASPVKTHVPGYTADQLAQDLGNQLGSKGNKP